MADCADRTANSVRRAGPASTSTSFVVGRLTFRGTLLNQCRALINGEEAGLWVTVFFLPTGYRSPGRFVEFPAGFGLKPEPCQCALDFASLCFIETDLVFGLLIGFFRNCRRIGGRRLLSHGSCQTRFCNLCACNDRQE